MTFKQRLLPAFFISLTAFSLVFAETNSMDYLSIESETQYSVLTPTLQSRKTAKIELPNGLQAYLISDPDIDQSAASISVEAGSWQDPDEYPGMAHFLEHMLFMGNKAYPDESEYSRYIQDHGGTMNAFTAPDRTVYMFSINNNAFLGALDRFSHFFIDPLFNPSCINRELLAVDQENSKNIENDGWREYMVLKETSNPDHPNRKFSTGSAATLSGIPQQALKSWYETHYSANRMHLILLSSLPLEEMIDLTVKSFSAVPDKDSDTSSINSSILSSAQKGHFIYVKPIKDLKTLSLIWEMPKTFSAVEQKWTAELISYALEQASDQSLVKLLKKEGLAESVSASLDRMGKEDCFFQLSVKLTEKGLSQIDTIILRCFQALARLKQNGLPLSLFQEIQTMAQINYQYQSRQEPFQWISEIAYQIVDEDLSSFPEKTLVPSEFNPQFVIEFLKELAPESCVYFVTADPSKLDIHPLTLEKWFQVEYAIRPILPSKLAVWQQVASHPDIQTPPSNPFVPTSLELIHTTKEETGPLIPSVILEKDNAKVYFAADKAYLAPEAVMLFHIKTPTLNGTAKSFALMDLFSKALREELSSTLFFAGKAGLSTFFSQKDMKFSLQIAGYSEKAPDLAKALFESLTKVQALPEQFNIYKESLLSQYANAALELPIKQASEILSSVLLNDAPTAAEKQKALSSISLEEFSGFCKEWLSEVFVEGMIYGNLSEEQQTTFTSSLETILKPFKPYLQKDQKKQEVLLLPSNKGPFKIVETTDRQGNGAMLLIQEGPFSFAKKASQQVLSKVLDEAFFKTIRTQQQVAYIANARPSELEKQLMHTFLVQSSSHDPKDLLARFEIFLEDFVKRIQEIVPKERFNELKTAQITALETPPENILAMTQRLDLLAFEYGGDFTRIEKRIASLKALTYEDFVQDTVEFLSRDNLKRLAVLIKGKATTQQPFYYQMISPKELEQLGTFTSGE
jgi:insulysin